VSWRFSCPYSVTQAKSCCITHAPNAFQEIWNAESEEATTRREGWNKEVLDNPEAEAQAAELRRKTRDYAIGAKQVCAHSKAAVY
jgi:hypothetical protein